MESLEYRIDRTVFETPKLGEISPDEIDRVAPSFPAGWASVYSTLRSWMERPVISAKSRVSVTARGSWNASRMCEFSPDLP